jgi:PhnB protein
MGTSMKKRKEIMSSAMSHVHKGFGVVRPYLHGPADLPEFLQKTFNAVELERNEDGPTLLQIGDSLLWIEAGDLPPHVSPWVGSIYVYVEDVDAVYGRAMQHGAKSIAPPEDKPYNERQAGFIDSGGNTWWVSTYKIR